MRIQPASQLFPRVIGAGNATSSALPSYLLNGATRSPPSADSRSRGCAQLLQTFQWLDIEGILEPSNSVAQGLCAGRVISNSECADQMAALARPRTRQFPLNVAAKPRGVYGRGGQS